MTTDNEIRNIEQAKNYFISMGCSHFHLDREDFKRANEYRSFNISSTTESLWRQEAFENKLENFHAILPNDYGWYFRGLCDMIERKDFYLEKIIELMNKIQERLPNDLIEIIMSTIIGTNGTKQKGGLIQMSFELNRKDLADKFYNKSRELLKKAEDNSVILSSVRSNLIDVVEYYGLEDNNEFLIDLRNKNYSDLFRNFKDGAEEGNKYSMRMLSKCYQEGKGCEIDMVKANYWVQKANA